MDFARNEDFTDDEFCDAACRSHFPTYEELRGKGGRKPKYDWDAIFERLNQLLESDDRPSSQRDCAREIRRWLEQRNAEPPSESHLRSKISRYLREQHDCLDEPAASEAKSRSDRRMAAHRPGTITVGTFLLVAFVAILSGITVVSVVKPLLSFELPAEVEPADVESGFETPYAPESRVYGQRLQMRCAVLSQDSVPVLGSGCKRLGSLDSI